MQYLLSIFKKELWSKELIAWYLYDCANSFLIINTIVYFSQWVVVDRGVSDFWFASPFIVGTAALVVVSPYIGSLGDRHRSHRSIFIWTTAASIGFAFLIYLAGRAIGDSHTSVFVALIFYGLYLFFFQLALVPYTAFLKYLAPAEHYGKVSGLGFGFSQVGNMLGLVITFPLTYGVLPFLGEPRLATVAVGAAAFLIFSLPSLVLLKSKPLPAAFVPEYVPFWQSTWQSLREARARPLVLRLLLAFYFFSDAIASFTLFATIYLQNVFGISDQIKVAMSLVLLLGFAVGAFGIGSVSDRIGHRRSLLAGLVGSTVIITLIALAYRISWLFILFPLFGIMMGVVYAVSRAYLASLISDHESGKFFGLCSLAERSASIMGPAVWGLTIWVFASAFPWNYRAAALAMAGLVAIGIVPLVTKPDQLRNKISEVQPR